MSTHGDPSFSCTIPCVGLDLCNMFIPHQLGTQDGRVMTPFMPTSTYN